jgi:hypothetical protein
MISQYRLDFENLRKKVEHKLQNVASVDVGGHTPKSGENFLGFNINLNQNSSPRR